MAKRKAKLPLREGTKLPPMTEEERLNRRKVGHPLDDFPLTPRMSKWREFDAPTAPVSGRTANATEPIIERTTEPLTERSLPSSTIPPPSPDTQHSTDNATLTTQPTTANEDHPEQPEPTTQRLPIRSSERIYVPTATPLSEPLTASPEPRSSKEAYVALDATHSASEAKIYSLLYRLSINRGQRTCRASLADIHESLGLSKNTIIRALRGLSEKLSIDVLDRRAGSRIGSLYYVYTVKEILGRRKEAGIEIDDYKRVVPKGTTVRMVERLIERLKTEPLNVQKSDVQLNVQLPTNSLAKIDLADSVGTTKNSFLRNDDDWEKSSSLDDEKKQIAVIREVYCDLSGNEWQPADQAEAEAILQVGLAHVILGICYSLDRAKDHRIQSLKYCIPAIVDHYRAMRSFPDKELVEIAYTHMARVKRALKTDQWDLKRDST